MLVLVTGMMRSGSTFTFNVAKHLLSRRGAAVYCEPVEEIEDVLQSRGDAYDHLIFKQHIGSDFSKLLIKQDCARTICSYRNPLDAMASWMQVFGVSFEESLELFKRSIDFISFQRHNALMIPYDEIEQAPGAVIQKVANYLEQPLEVSERAMIAASLDKFAVKRRCEQLERQSNNVRDLGFSYYDRDTFFHRRHIRGQDAVDSTEFFTGEQRAAIDQKLHLTID